MQEEEKQERLEFSQAIALVLSSDNFREGNFVFDITHYPLARGITFNDLKNLGRRLKGSLEIKTFSFINYKLGEKESTPELKATTGIDPAELKDTYLILSSILSTKKLEVQKETRADALASLFQGLPELTHITLSSTYMDQDESHVIIETLMKYQSRRLRSLVFNTNAIKLESLINLAKFLERPNCPLKYLQLQRCFLAMNVRPKLYVLIEALKKNSSLRMLDLTLCQLDDGELEEFSRMLDVNHHLVTVLYDARNPAHEARSNITAKLTRNSQQQTTLHNTLTERTFLIEEAYDAVYHENVSYLEVLLGIPKKHQPESEEYESENQRLSKAIKEETIRLAILKSQQEVMIKHLQKLSKIVASSVIQEDLDLSTNQLRKKLEDDFNQTSTPAVNRERTRAENRVMSQLLEEYQRSTLDPLFAELKLVLKETDSPILVKISLKSRIEEAEQHIEALKENQKQLHKHHKLYLTKRANLLTTLNKLNLSPTLENEKEEISANLIEVCIKPEDRTSTGQTLLFSAFVHAKSRTFETLLNTGADILAMNKDGNSVFLELMKNYQLRPTYTSARRYLEKRIREDFTTLRITEQTLLDEHQELLIEYLAVFSIQSRALKVSASVSPEPPAASKDSPILLSDGGAQQLAGLNLLALALYHMIGILSAAKQGKLTYLSNNQISNEVANFHKQFDVESLKGFLLNITNKGTMQHQGVSVRRQAPAAFELISLGPQPRTTLPLHEEFQEWEKGRAVKHTNGNHVKNSIPSHYSFVSSHSGTTMLDSYLQFTQTEDESVASKFP